MTRKVFSIRCLLDATVSTKDDQLYLTKLIEWAIILPRYTVPVVQLVERQIVDLVVVGSNPIGHPALRSVAALAFVAQPDRAVDFESEGCTFKSCRTR